MKALHIRHIRDIDLSSWKKAALENDVTLRDWTIKTLSEAVNGKHEEPVSPFHHTLILEECINCGKVHEGDCASGEDL